MWKLLPVCLTLGWRLISHIPGFLMGFSFCLFALRCLRQRLGRGNLGRRSALYRQFRIMRVNAKKDANSRQTAGRIGEIPRSINRDGKNVVDFLDAERGGGVETHAKGENRQTRFVHSNSVGSEILEERGKSSGVCIAEARQSQSAGGNIAHFLCRVICCTEGGTVSVNKFKSDTFNRMSTMASNARRGAGNVAASAGNQLQALVHRFRPARGRTPAAVSAQVPWLNHLVVLIWPRIAAWLKEVLGGILERAITNALPHGLKGRVNITTQIGDARPKFGRLTVINLQEDGIEARLAVTVDLDTNITISALGIHVGVSRIVLEGDCSVVFRNLVSRPPFFAGLEVHFANLPYLRIDFKGSAAYLTHVDSLRDVLQTVINDGIKGAIVLPNRVAVDLDKEDGTDIADLKKPDPIGVLRLTLRRAKNLPTANPTWFRRREAKQHFVVVSFGQKSWTSPAADGLDPQWGDDQTGIIVDFLVHSNEQQMSFQVFDGMNIQIGARLNVKLDDLTRQPEVALRLQAYQGSNFRSTGSLFVSAELLNIVAAQPVTMRAVESPFAPSFVHDARGSANVAYLAVKVIEIKGLPQSDGPEYPYKVGVRVGGTDEAMTRESYPKRDRKLDRTMQMISQRLFARGATINDIARELGVSDYSVVQFLALPRHNNPTMLQVLHDKRAKRAAENPQIFDVIQLLLPDPIQGALRDADIVLSLRDKRGHFWGSARVPLADVLDSASDLPIELPLLGPTSDAQLIGSAHLRWLTTVELGNSPQQRSSDAVERGHVTWSRTSSPCEAVLGERDYSSDCKWRTFGTIDEDLEGDQTLE